MIITLKHLHDGLNEFTVEIKKLLYLIGLLESSYFKIFLLGEELTRKTCILYESTLT